MSRYERIEAALRAAFSPSHLEIVDESRQHAGHAAQKGAAPNAETHFCVTMTAAALTGKSRLQRQRAVNEVLAAEFESGLHALSMTLRAPDEH